MKIILYFLFALFLSSQTLMQAQEFSIARLKYGGGGDWYNDPSSEVNLLNFIRTNSNIKVNAEYKFVDLATDEIFNYPFIFMTGHGNIILTSSEAERLRTYLESGGFLYVDDDYGFDKSFRRELKKIFPNNNLVELPHNFGLYNSFFSFPNGVPKTHEHDNKPPQGFGIFINNRLVLYYTYETNPSDGWADKEVHNNTPEKREESLKFGMNIVIWALSN
ncbi:MAG: hypothetical protein C0425_07810 [Chlorobiaceae bacterium]|nr:hypothetical protein [Chlorobiaceae bacterium]MBA4310227.1 hypothetical protein [Chlorobiaceae bacterium]